VHKRKKSPFHSFVQYNTILHVSKDYKVCNKRKSTPIHSLVEESPRIEEGDYDTTSEEEEEASQPRSMISQGRPATSASTLLAQVMRVNQKTTPSAAAASPARAATITASQASSSRARSL